MNATKFTLPSDREILIERVFDAPAGLIFKAVTDPDLVQKWWGPRRFTTIVEKDEVRPGGQWRYVQTGTDGNKYAFYGVYREVAPGRKISRTFEFEGMPGHIMTESCAFEEQGGKTKLKVTCAFDTKEERDGMYSSGMEAGASESWDQLAEVLAAMKQGSKHN